MQAKRNQRFGGNYNLGGQAHVSNEDWFEVFISGKGYPHNLANISSKTVKQVILDSNGNVQHKSSHAMLNQSLVVGVD